MTGNDPLKETNILPVVNLVEKSHDSPAKFPDITSNLSASDLIAQMTTPITSAPVDDASTQASPSSNE